MKKSDYSLRRLNFTVLRIKSDVLHFFSLNTAVTFEQKISTSWSLWHRRCSNILIKFQPNPQRIILTWKILVATQSSILKFPIEPWKVEFLQKWTSAANRDLVFIFINGMKTLLGFLSFFLFYLIGINLYKIYQWSDKSENNMNWKRKLFTAGSCHQHQAGWPDNGTL